MRSEVADDVKRCGGCTRVFGITAKLELIRFPPARFVPVATFEIDTSLVKRRHSPINTSPSAVFVLPICARLISKR